MDNALVLETTFLIDLERELARGAVVTRNARHYRRVPGLEVEAYPADRDTNGTTLTRTGGL